MKRKHHSALSKRLRMVRIINMCDTQYIVYKLTTRTSSICLLVFARLTIAKGEKNHVGVVSAGKIVTFFMFSHVAFSIMCKTLHKHNHTLMTTITLRIIRFSSFFRACALVDNIFFFVRISIFFMNGKIAHHSFVLVPFVQNQC